MRGDGGIVVRALIAWLRRRGWIVVPPSGVGEIAGVCGVSSCGPRVRGAARDEFEPESPALRAIRSFDMPPGPYC